MWKVKSDGNFSATTLRTTLDPQNDAYWLIRASRALGRGVLTFLNTVDTPFPMVLIRRDSPPIAEAFNFLASY
jgi:hypothetical protein